MLSDCTSKIQILTYDVSEYPFFWISHQEQVFPLIFIFVNLIDVNCIFLFCPFMVSWLIVSLCISSFPMAVYNRSSLNHPFISLPILYSSYLSPSCLVVKSLYLFLILALSLPLQFFPKANVLRVICSYQYVYIVIYILCTPAPVGRHTPRRWQLQYSCRAVHLEMWAHCWCLSCQNHSFHESAVSNPCWYDLGWEGHLRSFKYFQKR